VAQLVEALRYKPESRGVRFPMVSLAFFIDVTVSIAVASNSNEYQEYFLGVNAAGA
jgi:hypothetical protein